MRIHWETDQCGDTPTFRHLSRGRSKYSFSAGAKSTAQCIGNLTEVAGTGGLSPAGVPVAEVAHRAAVIVVVI